MAVLPNVLTVLLVALCYFVSCSSARAAPKASSSIELSYLVLGGMTSVYPPSSPLTSDPIFIPVGNENPFPYGPVFYASFRVENPNATIEIFANEGNSNTSLGKMYYDKQNSFWLLSSDIQVVVPSTYTIKVNSNGNRKNFNIAVVGSAIQKSNLVSGIVKKQEIAAKVQAAAGNPFVFMTFLSYSSDIMPYFPQVPLWVNPVTIFVSGRDVFAYGATLVVRLSIADIDNRTGLSLYTWDPKNPNSTDTTFLAQGYTGLIDYVWTFTLNNRPTFPTGYQIQLQSYTYGYQAFNITVESILI